MQQQPELQNVLLLSPSIQLLLPIQCNLARHLHAFQGGGEGVRVHAPVRLNLSISSGNTENCIFIIVPTQADIQRREEKLPIMMATMAQRVYPQAPVCLPLLVQ